MSDLYLDLKVLHILSSTVLFGTGIGTAFQMWMTHRGGDIRAIAAVARNVVIADFLFTTPAGIIQPSSGVLLLWMAGFDPFSSWLIATYMLYIIAGLCWLPVVWLQIRVRDMAVIAASTHHPLPADYHRFMRLWFILGWPAFIALTIVFWLMATKPALW